MKLKAFGFTLWDENQPDLDVTIIHREYTKALEGLHMIGNIFLYSSIRRKGYCELKEYKGRSL